MRVRKETQTAKNEGDEAECKKIFAEIFVENCRVEHIFRLE